MKKQLTLVAMYGQKTKKFTKYIDGILNLIKKTSIEPVFETYRSEQWHMTIVGLEKRWGFEENYNANFWVQENVNKTMKFEGLYEKLDGYFPVKVQVGGFKKSNNTFKSFGSSLYLRSFGIKVNQKSVNLIGWSVNDDYSENRRLLKLRESIYLENKIRHRYLDEQDNDFYMVLGKLKGLDSWDETALMQLNKSIVTLETQVRNYLQNNPFQFKIEVDDLYIIQYEEPTLNPSTSQAWSVRQLEKYPDLIERIYQEEI